MNPRFLVVIAIGLASASTATAQRDGRIGVSTPHTRESRNADSAAFTQPNEAGTIARFFGSAILATGGLFVGANVGAGMEGPCGCDDPGLEGAILGGLLGNAIGASIAAAAPKFGSVCSFDERLARSVVGSLAGTAIGLVSFAGAPIGLFTIPVGAAGGSVLALGHCLRSRGG
jgi:hypothetical protein